MTKAKPKVAKYSDRIAHQRKMDTAILAALVKPAMSRTTLLAAVTANLRARVKYSKNGREIVRWMGACGVPLCSFEFEEAIESLEQFPSDRLQAMANAMGVGV